MARVLGRVQPVPLGLREHRVVPRGSGSRGPAPTPSRIARACCARRADRPPAAARRASAAAARRSGCGSRSSSREREVGRVALIAGEALVAAVAVERHRHVFAGEARQVEGGQRRVIGERLAVVTHELRQDLDRVGAHDSSWWSVANSCAISLRLWQLVEALLLESDRERLDRLAMSFRPSRPRPPRSRCRPRGRLPSGRRRPSGVAPPRGSRRESPPPAPAAGLCAALAGVVQAPVALGLHRPVAIDEGARRHQLAHRRECAQRRRNAAVGQVGVERLVVDLPRNLRILHQRSELRGEAERATRARSRTAASCRRGHAPAAAGAGGCPTARTRTSRAARERTPARAPRRGGRSPRCRPSVAKRWPLPRSRRRSSRKL